MFKNTVLVSFFNINIFMHDFFFLFFDSDLFQYYILVLIQSKIGLEFTYAVLI